MAAGQRSMGRWAGDAWGLPIATQALALRRMQRTVARAARKLRTCNHAWADLLFVQLAHHGTCNVHHAKSDVALHRSRWSGDACGRCRWVAGSCSTARARAAQTLPAPGAPTSTPTASSSTFCQWGLNTAAGGGRRFEHQSAPARAGEMDGALAARLQR